MSEHQFDEFIGELAPGDKGWLPLDEAGTPIGPATLEPPEGPNAMACSVSLSHDGHLVSSSGAPLEPPLNSNIDKRVPGGETSSTPPVLNSVSPATAAVGSVPLQLMAAGSGFTASAVIVFAGADLATTFVSANSVTAQVDPTSASAGIVKVSVRDTAGSTAEVDFEFTPAGRSGTRSDEDRRRQSGR